MTSSYTSKDIKGERDGRYAPKIKEDSIKICKDTISGGRRLFVQDIFGLKYTLKYSCTGFQLIIRFLVCLFFLIRVSFHTIKWCHKTIIWQTFLNLYIVFTIYKKLLYHDL